jgi:hypothetical protein
MKLTAGFYWILVGLSLTSCEWFASPETKTQQLVEEELSAIDWNEVDQYPLFDTCEETASKPEQQTCFEQNLVMHLSMSLQDFEFHSEEQLADTLFVDFMVDHLGKIFVVSMDKNPEFSKENPEFERIVSKSLRSLPRLEPALKRGIPVSSRFRIPLVLNTDD